VYAVVSGSSCYLLAPFFEFSLVDVSARCTWFLCNLMDVVDVVFGCAVYASDLMDVLGFFAI
jgi:uncharacterized membrane protein YpjA